MKNPPFFSQTKLAGTSFTYPATAPKLEAGKRYAWTITKGTRTSAPSMITVMAANNDADIDVFRIITGTVTPDDNATAANVVLSGLDPSNCSSGGQGCFDMYTGDKPTPRGLKSLIDDSVGGPPYYSALVGRVTVMNDREKRAPAGAGSDDSSPPHRSKPGEPDTLPGVIDGGGNPDNCKRCPGTATLRFEFTKAPLKPDSSIHLVYDVDLSPDLCRQLGLDSARIPKGDYRIDRSIGPNGGVEFPGSAINTSRSNIPGYGGR
jgi:hypothetical protein